MKIKNRKRFRLILIGTAIIVLISVTAFVMLRSQTSEKPGETGIPAVYTVQEMVSSTTIDVSGNIEPALSADLTFGVSGVVAGIFVEEGDTVNKDTLLAKLEDIEIIYEITSLQYDIDEAAITGSQKNLALLKLQNEVLQAELQDTRIEAPFDGLVSEVNIDVGDNVAAGSAENAYTAIRLINTAELTAEVEIDEIDVPMVKIGQKVKLVFDALPDLEVIGTITKISPEARVTDQGIAVADAEINVQNPSPQILPYYSFTGEILMNEEDKVLVIDREAIIERDGSTMALKISEDGGRPTPVEVKVSEYDGSYYRVITGLQNGDQLIAPPSNRQAQSGTDAESDSSNPLQMLGLPTPGTGGGRGGDGPPPR